MKTTLRFIAATSLLCSAPVLAGGPLSYTYISAAYGKSYQDAPTGDLAGDVAGVDLSINIGETGVALDAGYDAGQLKANTSAGSYKEDDKSAHLGVLYHHAVTESSDLIFGVAVGRQLAQVKLNSVLTLKGDNVVRWFYVGARGMALDKLELRGYLVRGQYNDGFTSGIRLGGSYYLVKRVSVDLNYLGTESTGELAGNGQTFYGGLTFYFN